ncbi:MAG: response regulator, partial [Olsenella sp.]
MLIVEDVPAEAAKLRSHLDRYAHEHDTPFSVEVLSSALEFVETRHVADLIFMDINMPGINGMEAAELLRTYDSET